MLLIVNVAVSGHRDFKIVIMQDETGAAARYRPLLDYLKARNVDASFVAARSYTHAAQLFAAGSADGMFSGSGIAGCMIIKDLAYPIVRPVSIDGWSTYWAVVIGPKGSKRFTQNADYFINKKVIFCGLASAGEFYYRAVTGSLHARAITLKASSHGAALDALARQAADFAVVKNRVWNRDKQKYPGLARLGEDPGKNPNGTLIVSKKADPTMVEKLKNTLLALENDPSPDASTAKQKLQITGFLETTSEDFIFTIRLLQRAGVNRQFHFAFD
jgi:ABC-type phosphate/phosphonate transport system substrate-binding protein